MNMKIEGRLADFRSLMRKCVNYVYGCDSRYKDAVICMGNAVTARGQRLCTDVVINQLIINWDESYTAENAELEADILFLLGLYGDGIFVLRNFHGNLTLAYIGIRLPGSRTGQQLADSGGRKRFELKDAPTDSPLTFGFELEISHSAVLSTARDVKNKFKNEGGISVDWSHSFQTDSWVLTTDSSVNNLGLEIKSPILNSVSALVLALTDLTSWLNQYEIRSDRSCGFHLHIGKQVLPWEPVGERVAWQQDFYGLDFSKTLPGHRLNNDYCSFSYTSPSEKYQALSQRHNTYEFRAAPGTNKLSPLLDWCLWAVGCVRCGHWTQPPAIEW